MFIKLWIEIELKIFTSDFLLKKTNGFIPERNQTMEKTVFEFVGIFSIIKLYYLNLFIKKRQMINYDLSVNLFFFPISP